MSCSSFRPSGCARASIHALTSLQRRADALRRVRWSCSHVGQKQCVPLPVGEFLWLCLIWRSWVLKRLAVITWGQSDAVPPDLGSVMEFLPFLSSPYTGLQARPFPFRKQHADMLAVKTSSSCWPSVGLFGQRAFSWQGMQGTAVPGIWPEAILCSERVQSVVVCEVCYESHQSVAGENKNQPTDMTRAADLDKALNVNCSILWWCVWQM